MNRDIQSVTPNRSGAVTANHELASSALALADDHARMRKVALCAYVALATTRTIAAARKALAEWDGPGDISARAVELLDRLEGQ